MYRLMTAIMICIILRRTWLRKQSKQNSKQASKQISSSKGLGQNPEVTFAPVKKNQIGGVDVFFSRQRPRGKRIEV